MSVFRLHVLMVGPGGLEFIRHVRTAATDPDAACDRWEILTRSALFRPLRLIRCEKVEYIIP